MSALIPMTKLPDNCAIGGRDGLGCPCFCHYNEECQLLGETIHTAYFSDEKRPERCPLQFVPPHGRLIDADAFVNKNFGKEYLSKVMTAGKDEMETALVNIPLVINNAPTILQAEEVEA